MARGSSKVKVIFRILHGLLFIVVAQLVSVNFNEHYALLLIAFLAGVLSERMGETKK